MATNINLTEEAKEIEKRIPTPEHRLAKGLFQPFNDTNSGSRKLLANVHREHAVPLLNPEVALITTGYENEFGRYSSSFIEAKSDYLVISKIAKFSKLQAYNYIVILLDMENNMLDFVERVSYKHITEAYGFDFNNCYLDSLEKGVMIYKGDVVKKSTSFDSYNNRIDGVNLLTMYLSSDDTMEDGIEMSKSAAKKFEFPLYKKIPIMINDNDILLNLYGDNNTYKTIPDIGENVKDGLVCAIRRHIKEESLFTQSYNRLRDIMMSDEKITTEGEVVDLNIYCNNPERLKSSFYYNQLKYYYDENIRFCTEIVNVVENTIGENKNLKMTYLLQKLYYTCKDVLAGKPYIKEKQFSNIIMEIIVREIKGIEQGDKFADRYGGKGVVPKIIDDELMPKLDTGETIEVVYNQATVVNRNNAGQLFETELNFISSYIVNFIRTGVLDFNESFSLIYKFVKLVNEEQAEYMFDTIMSLEDEDRDLYIQSLCEDNGILLSLRPISDSVTIDDIAKIYKEFPWINQRTLTVPIEDSNGNIRYIEARRKVVAGRKYIYRLKQYAEEKFSVTSLSATNLRNENTRSKANKLYKGLFTKTPIRFGGMESGNLSHLGMETVIVNLMLYSTSPHGRRLTEQLLTGDPFNIDIKLDENSKNRSVEIFNTLFKTMGLALSFEKVYKDIRKPLFRRHPLINYNRMFRKPIRYIPEEERATYDNDKEFLKYRKEGVPFGFRRPLFRRHPLINYGKNKDKE